MARDMELVRKLILMLDEKHHVIASERNLAIPGYRNHVIHHHMMLLTDSSLVVAVPSSTGGISQFRITSQGHDFAEAIRSDTNWNKAVDALQKAGVFGAGVGFSLLVEYIKAEIRKITGLP